MEVLGIGLAAFIALKKKQERIVPGPAEFKAFDLRTLGHLYDAEKVLPAGRLIGSDCMWPRPCPDGRAYEPPLMIQIPPRRPFVGSAVAVALNLVIGNAHTSQRIEAVKLLSKGT